MRSAPSRACAERATTEYDDISAVTADDVGADAASVRTLLAMAAQLAPMLRVFTD